MTINNQMTRELSDKIYFRGLKEELLELAEEIATRKGRLEGNDRLNQLERLTFELGAVLNEFEGEL